MAVRAPGDFPPDESGAPPFQDEVDLPWWKGGGQGFGPGGFFNSPKLTGPATGPTPGTSLATTMPTNAAGMGPHVDPTTGQPEMLTGPGGLVEKTRGSMNPFGFIGGGNPYWRGAIAGAGAIAPTPTANDAAPTNLWMQRPSGVGGLPGPQVTNPPFQQPDHPSTMRYPMWPTPPAPTAAAPLPPSRPVTPTPATAYPATPAASPAVTRQRPNLGTYGAPPAAVANSPFTTLDYRPNSGPNERNRGSPVATALDLSRLFGGGQPASVAAAPIAARPDLAQRVPLAQTPLPPRRPKVKVSSTSEGGGYNT